MDRGQKNLSEKVASTLAVLGITLSLADKSNQVVMLGVFDFA